MHAGVPAPLPERLANKVEQDAKRAPQEDKRHVQHDGRDEAAGNGPWCDEFAKAVAPEVLVDSDGDEDGAGDGPVAVDGVR